MDFWFHFDLQRKNLQNPTIIPQILDEEGRIQLNTTQFNIFRDHLPLTPEDFWQTSIVNISNSNTDCISKIKDDLLEYMLIMINWYTEEYTLADSSGICALLASQFYFKLLNLMGMNHFKNVIFENVLKNLKKHSKNKEAINVLKELRSLLADKKLDEVHLENVLFNLVSIIQNNSNRVFHSFPLDSLENDLALQAFLCMKCLAVQDVSKKGHSIINYALFHGLISEKDSEYMRKNLRNLMIDLKPFLSKDTFANFQNVFLFIVAKSHKFDAMEACKILTSFDETFCKETVFKLTKMGTSKEVVRKENLLRLLAKLLEHLPVNYYPNHKLKVFIQSTLNILILNCLNNDEIISIISKIFLLNKDIINKEFEILLNTPTEHIYFENSLKTFFTKFNPHWIDRRRNKNIAIIILRIMLNTFDSSLDEKYGNIFASIGRKADPNDMKITIPLILKLFTHSKKKHSKYLSEKILEFLYSMSVHPSNGSAEFLKTTFDLILNPNEEMTLYKSEIIPTFSNLIIEDNKVFIQKANELKLLDSNSIKQLINKIMEGEYEFVRITCAVVEKSPSPQGEKIIYHLMANPLLLSEGKYVSDLLFIANSGMKYFVTSQENLNLTETQQNNLNNFSKLLWEEMNKFNLSYNALSVGLEVLENLSKLHGEEIDENQQSLFTKIEVEMKNTLLKLPTIGTENCFLIPLIYATELISNKKFGISDEIIEILHEALEKILKKLEENAHLNCAKLETQHYFCLVFIVRISMRYSKYASKSMEFLKKSMESTSNDTFRISLMDLMYDLSSFVVHNFNEFLNYTFENLKSSNVNCRKQAAKHIEHFVRMDYLKLTLEQFCKFICLLGDPSVEKSVLKILTNFATSNQGIVEKYFVGLIMHINLYSHHPMCMMSNKYKEDMKLMIRPNYDKWKLYSTLFRSLPVRSKILILKEICTSIYNEFMHGKLKIDETFWNMIRDSIKIFKIMAYTSLDSMEYREFYKNTLKDVEKYLILKHEIQHGTALKCPEMQEAVEHITYSILHLLFYTENDSILRNYQLKLFEAILFWTHDLFPDIATLCREKKGKTMTKISNYYKKLNNFYENHVELLQNETGVYISEYNETRSVRIFNF